MDCFVEETVEILVSDSSLRHMGSQFGHVAVDIDGTIYGRAIKTVFVINNLSYTAGGQVKQLVTAPYIKDGRTMLPVRAVGESLGLEASWDHATKTATFKNAEKTAIVKIGQSTITVNNTPMPLTVPAEIKNGSTMIELRSLATAFGVSIAWDAVNKSVTVN